MAILKVILLSSMAVSLSIAKVDFVKFSDICKKTATQSCKNNPTEIKAVQYLLKKRVNPAIKVTGELDKTTLNTIISLQQKEQLPSSGYIGSKTKDVLNKVLYGHKLHKQKVAKKAEPKKKIAKKSRKKVKSKKIVKATTKKINKKLVAKAKIEAKNKKTKSKKLLAKTKVTSKKLALNKKVSSKAKLLSKKEKTKKLLAKNRVKSKNIKKLIAKNSKANKKEKNEIVKNGKYKSYQEFKNSVNLRKSYAVYQNPKLLKRAGGKNTLLKVDVSDQRVRLVVDGKIALDAPCTTGSKHKLEPNTRTYRDKRTPLGTFRVMEKIATKRSNIFGDIYRDGKRIYHGDRRKYQGSWDGVKFVGAPLKNWMRLTSGGIGLHASTHVKRYPGSNGCIRLLPKVANTLFKKVKPGTKVKVVN